MKEKTYQIAIDGPAGVGSSTTAKLIAERFGFLYVDTGAMYRAVTLLSINSGISFENEDEVAEVLKQSKIELRRPNRDEKDGRLITVMLDGEDVSWKIRSKEVSENVAMIAAMPKVREVLVKIQQEIASDQNVVMEGRDITYKVLPNADLKIFLTAEEEERAKRRHLQAQMRGEVVTYDQVLVDMKKRDEIDTNRESDPLKIVEDAWVLDTTNLSIDEVVMKIINKFKVTCE